MLLFSLSLSLSQLLASRSLRNQVRPGAARLDMRRLVDFTTRASEKRKIDRLSFAVFRCVVFLLKLTTEDDSGN